MRAFVSLRLPDQTVTELTHGDIVGRMATAALRLDDARVSEAHALVSLRGSELKLLALRGRFALDGKPVSEVVLEAGQTVWLARDLPLQILDVALPDSVLVLDGPGLGSPVLAGSVGILARPEGGLRLGPAAHPDALARVWNRDAGWRLQRADGSTAELVPGAAVALGDHRLVPRVRSLSKAGAAGTVLREGAIGLPLRIVCHHDVVHIHRPGEPTLAFSGIGARIISELVAFGGPVDWDVLAGEVWTHVHDRRRLRRNLDVALGRLRQRLQRAHIRKTLVQSDGGGKLALILQAGDTVEDEG